MNTARTALLTCACLLAVAAYAPAADPKPDPREKIDSAIAEGVRLLEAKDYTTFLKTFVAPDDLKKITERQTLDELAKQFAADKADGVLKVLKAVKGMKPVESAEDKVTYEHKVEGAGKKTITFVKVDKLWYIKN